MEQIKESLTFSDGTELDKSSVHEGNNDLFVHVGDESKTLIDVFQILSDPKKTAMIIYNYWKTELTFEGYTELTALSKEGKEIFAKLTKGKGEKSNGSD